MTGGAAPACGPSSLKPLFRCKVLKPPRHLVPPQERVVTHPPIDVVAGVIRRDDGRLLISQRLADDTLGGYWEFPGGKVDPGEEKQGKTINDAKFTWEKDSNSYHVITAPFAVIKQLLHHPLTDSGLKKFLADWEHAKK